MYPLIKLKREHKTNSERHSVVKRVINQEQLALESGSIAAIYVKTETIRYRLVQVTTIFETPHVNDSLYFRDVKFSGNDSRLKFKIDFYNNSNNTALCTSDWFPRHTIRTPASFITNVIIRQSDNFELPIYLWICFALIWWSKDHIGQKDRYNPGLWILVTLRNKCIKIV